MSTSDSHCAVTCAVTMKTAEWIGPLLDHPAREDAYPKPVRPGISSARS
jgi:hypothetical protein